MGPIAGNAPNFTRLLAANNSNAAYSFSFTPTLILPSSNVFPAYPSMATGLFVGIMPFGIGTAAQTFTMRLIGWRKTINGLWVPSILWDATCTLGTLTGIAGGDVLNTEQFASAIGTPTTGMGSEHYDVFTTSPANNTPAHVWVNAKGCSMFTCDFATGSSATSANALVAVA
jgi:hypothetical protein